MMTLKGIPQFREELTISIWFIIFANFLIQPF